MNRFKLFSALLATLCVLSLLFAPNARAASSRAFTIDDVTILEGSAGTQSAVFTVRLTKLCLTTLTIDYATSNGSAQAGADFAATAGRLRFEPGRLSRTIVVPILGDALPEADETFFVDLSNSRCVVARPRATGVILDDDGVLTLSVAPNRIVETGTALATVSRNTPATVPLLVTLSSSRPDRARVPANVTIPVGSASATFPVSGVNDAIVQGAISVDIRADTTRFATAIAPVLVLDDEARLTVTVNPGTFSEAAGTNAAIGTVSRNTPTGAALSVAVSSSDPSKVLLVAATPGVAARAAATRAATSQIAVTIPAGQTSANFAIDAVDDQFANGTQSVGIVASQADQGFAPGVATVTVVENDAAVLNLTLAPTTIAEPAVRAGANTSIGTITRNTPANAPLLVNLSLNAPDHPNQASVPASVVIPAGQRAATFAVTVTRDGLASDAAVSVTASASGLRSSIGVLTVVNSDAAALGLTLAPATLSEPDFSQPNTSTGTVSRNTPTTAALTVTLSSSAPNQASVPPSVTIPAGQRTATFPISVTQNGFAFDSSVVISASASGLQPASATLTVTNTDSALLSVTIAPDNILEPTTGTVGVTGTVTRNTATATALTVNLSLDAFGHPNQASVPPTVTIPAGQPSATFLITVARDGISSNATVFVSAAAPGFFSNGDFFTVANSDPLVLGLSFDPTTISETPQQFPGAAPNTSTGTITRNSSEAVALIVNLASNDTDQVQFPPTVSIPAGQSSATFTVTGKSDGITVNRRVTITASANTSNTSAILDVQNTDFRGPNVGPRGLSGSGALLSTVSARTNDDSLQLVFTQEMANVNGAQFSVYVNKTAVIIESASRAGSIITLQLPKGTLRAGDSVIVSWRKLLDAQNRAVPNGMGVTTAR